MSNKNRGFTSVELLSVILAIALCGGWIANIVKLIHLTDGPINAMLIVRAFGVLMAPLGAFMGFF